MVEQASEQAERAERPAGEASTGATAGVGAPSSQVTGGSGVSGGSGGDMIRTIDLRVDYDDVTAVADLNLSIPRGEVFGLIGPNGAGKTSALNVLATLIEPTYGEVYIDGVDVVEHPPRVRSVMGYMPDLPPVYDDLKVWESLDLFAAAYGIEEPTRSRRVESLLGRVSLTAKRDAMCKGLSRGMKQRLALAKTLLHEPRVLLLDEPASGLDPIARIELRQTLRAYSEAGGTVLISSHILSELADMCGSVGIMEAGRMVVSGRIDQITSEMAGARRIEVELYAEADGCVEAVGGLAGVQAIDGGERGLTVYFEGDDEAVGRLLREMVEAGVPMRSFHEKRMNLEDILVRSNAREVS